MGSRHIIEDLAEAGFHVEGIYACGGGARSELWLQIHADMTGIPLYLPALTHEASVLGTAICAAVGAGLFPDLKTAANTMVRIVRQIDPDPQHHSAYGDLYRHYLATYPALRDLMHEVARED
jgi:ribulose kinase